MLSVENYPFMLSAIMLSIVLVNVIILSIVAPFLAAVIYEFS